MPVKYAAEKVVKGKKIYNKQHIQYYGHHYANVAGRDSISRIILGILTSALENCQYYPHERPPEGLCFKFFKMWSSNLWQLTPQVVQICQLLDRIGYQKESDRILDLLFRVIGSKGHTRQFIHDMNCDPALARAFIDCCYRVQQIPNAGRWKHIDFCHLGQYVLEQLNSVEALLPDHEESFYHLICLLRDEQKGFWRYKKLPLDETERIVQKYGEVLSIRTLKKLAEYGRKADYTSLY